MTIITMGIDLAKHIFAVHGVDALDEPALARPGVKRDALPGLMAKLPPLPAPGGGGDMRDAQRLPKDASTAPASASSRQGVTAIGTTSAHCA